VSCFRQTRFRQERESKLNDEDVDADLCSALLSKWVTELSATRF
jgi:hypothetical protein